MFVGNTSQIVLTPFWIDMSDPPHFISRCFRALSQAPAYLLKPTISVHFPFDIAFIETRKLIILVNKWDMTSGE